MSLRYFLTTLTVVAWVLVSVPDATAQSADIIIANGKILTVDAEFSVAHSLASMTAGSWPSVRLRPWPVTKVRIPGSSTWEARR